MACCAIGPCDASRDRGGPGCDMCDRVAKLPQPSKRSTLLDETTRAEQAAQRAQQKSSTLLPK